MKAFAAVAHRGAPTEYPGNTMKSFVRAAALGCDMVECDVRIAADGALVLAHDEDVVDTRSRRWKIVSHAGDELAALDLGAGEGVPRLDDLVAAMADRCGVMADMKCEGAGVEEKVAQALAPLPRSRKIVAGASAEGRRRFREADTDLPLSLTLSLDDRQILEGDGFDRLLADIDTHAATWQYGLLPSERISRLKGRGLMVFAWTVDDLATMRRLIADGVDGLISNRPDIMARL